MSKCTGPFSDAFDCPEHDPRKTAPAPEPDTVEWWRSVAQGLGVKAFTLEREIERLHAKIAALDHAD